MYVPAFGVITFQPPPTVVKQNNKRSDPVEFDLSPVDDASMAKLKGFIFASAWMVHGSSANATESQIQNAVSGFRNIAGVFTNGVEAVRNLGVPLALAKKVGLVSPEQSKSLPSDYVHPIKTGAEFELVAPYLQALSTSVAFKLSEVSSKSEIDPSFFASATTSRKSSGSRSGSARRVQTPNEAGGTADSRTGTDRS